MNWCELFFSVLKWAKFGRVRRGKNCKKQKNFRNFLPESPDGGAMVGDAFEKAKVLLICVVLVCLFRLVLGGKQLWGRGISAAQKGLTGCDIFHGNSG
ncbi:hypothetical protein [Corynebacterium sp.]|uniref:hypothetical protein n=1 Tax=Corynebacterium sp. TaxID=1720 RepID=UPI0026DA7CA5|nr:hypothetical protein [Corynebacterium sp.]